MLPDWPTGTVAILVTLDEGPHAIPVSAILRAGPACLVMGLADTRGSLQRIREHPQVAVALLAEGRAITARGRARVIEEPVSDGVSAVEVQVDAVDDHLRPTFALESGVRWRWTDASAEARDDAVRAGLARLVAGGSDAGDGDPDSGGSDSGDPDSGDPRGGP